MVVDAVDEFPSPLNFPPAELAISLSEAPVALTAGFAWVTTLALFGHSFPQ